MLACSLSKSWCMHRNRSTNRSLLMTSRRASNIQSYCNYRYWATNLNCPQHNQLAKVGWLWGEFRNRSMKPSLHTKLTMQQVTPSSSSHHALYYDPEFTEGRPKQLAIHATNWEKHCQSSPITPLVKNSIQYPHHQNSANPEDSCHCNVWKLWRCVLLTNAEMPGIDVIWAWWSLPCPSRN